MASGGTGPLSYKFYLYDGTRWTAAQDWTTSSSFTWAPSAAGTYLVQVWVRNAGSTASYDAVRSSGAFTVTVPD
jgi:stage II sporulation protein D